MILTRAEAQRVSGGRKTQHRIRRGRAVPDIGSLIPISYWAENPALGYRPDGSPKREAVRACRVRLISFWPSTPAEATGDDARAEGLQHRNQILAAWGQDREANLWVLRWELHLEEIPRYLSRGVVAGRQGDYTQSFTRAYPGELEAVDADTLERFSRTAREAHQERSHERRRAIEALPLEAEMAALAAEAKARHIDIRDEARAFRRWQDPEARRRQVLSVRAKLAIPLPASARMG